MKKHNKTKKDNKALVETNLIDEIVSGIIEARNSDKRYTKKRAGKREKFFLYWILGLPIRTCGKLAGYTEQYSYKLVQKYRNNSKIRSQLDEILNVMPDRYRQACKLRLIDVADIEGKALQEYQNDAKLAIDKPQLLKQVKQGAGINDDVPQHTHISIEEAQNLMISINQQGGQMEAKEKEDIINDNNT